MYESFEECGAREVFEEAEVKIDRMGIEILAVTNNFWPEHKSHYVTIFLLAKYVSGTPVGVEPDKCDHWTWFDIDVLPDDLFESITVLTYENKIKIREFAER